MPAPKAQQNPMKSDFFPRSNIGTDEAIVRVIRPSADDPFVQLWMGHSVTVPDPEKESGERWCMAYCLGTGADPTNPEVDDDGLRVCQTIGPIGDSGAFLHDFDWQWWFSTFLYVHSLGGVRLNRVQIWSRPQGAPSTGVYCELAAAMDTAEDNGNPLSQVLLKIKGYERSQKKGQYSLHVSYIGPPAGKYADYDLTDRMKTEIKERMTELRDKWEARKSEAEIRELLGVGPAKARGSDAGNEPPDPFDSGLDGHPKLEDDLP